MQIPWNKLFLPVWLMAECQRLGLSPAGRDASASKSPHAAGAGNPRRVGGPFNFSHRRSKLRDLRRSL
jgi:hypothetical protein